LEESLNASQKTSEEYLKEIETLKNTNNQINDTSESHENNVKQMELK